MLRNSIIILKAFFCWDIKKIVARNDIRNNNNNNYNNFVIKYGCRQGFYVKNICDKIIGNKNINHKRKEKKNTLTVI